jgi:inosine-uridine nucleoside N-ribohydrolase
MMNSSMRLIIDCDPAFGIPGADIDDCLAIALALRSPDVVVDAITVVAGNVGVGRGEQAARRLLELAGRSDIPVYLGAARPLIEPDEAWRSELDGRGGRSTAVRLWKGVESVPEIGIREASIPAAAAIIERVMQAAGEMTVVAIGPLTNIAIALSLEPRLAGALKSLVVMGGAIHVTGSANELNFGYDPEAANIVLTSGAPVTVVPLDLTRQTLLRPEDNERFIRSGDRMIEAVGRVAAPWLAWVMAERKQDGCFLHDPLAVAAAIDPSLLICERLEAAVELSGGYTRGRVVTWRPGAHTLKLEPPRRIGLVDIAQRVDNPRFMELMMGRLTGDVHV